MSDLRCALYDANERIAELEYEVGELHEIIEGIWTRAALNMTDESRKRWARRLNDAGIEVDE